MEINSISLIMNVIEARSVMKIEINNKFTKNTFYKSMVEQEKQDFLKIIKKLQVKQGKKFSVYTIAAKIARGESVSSEELEYIKQNAPSLLAEAKEQNREREKTEREENSTSKETKQTNSSNQVDNDSTKTSYGSEKFDTNSKDSLMLLINKNIM